jgi:F-type H+-transporting ATPase subunit b
MSDLSSLYVLAHGAVAEHGAEAAEHAGPNLFGFGPTFIVAASMTVLVLIALYLKVPKMLTSGLDAGIAEIKKQLEEAKSLRAEAEALRKEYADKIANAEKDAAAMLDHARHEADAIIAKAEADTTTVIARREKMAADKISAAERGAVDELRTRAAQAATAAAGQLIAAKHGAEADKALVDAAIGAI